MQVARIDEATAPPQRRRWGRTIIVVSLVLLAYAVALAWATRRLEADVQRSLHPLPAVQQDSRAED